MALYPRLLGFDDAGNPVEAKILLHPFKALLGEVARGELTMGQARDAIPSISRGGVPLTPAEETEAIALLTSITSLGTATAKLARAQEIDDVLIAGEHRTTGYHTPTLVQTRLGG